MGRFLDRLIPKTAKQRAPAEGGTAALMDMKLFLKEPDAGLAAARSETGVVIKNEAGTALVASSSASPRPLSSEDDEDALIEVPTEFSSPSDNWLD